MGERWGFEGKFCDQIRGWNMGMKTGWCKGRLCWWWLLEWLYEQAVWWTFMAELPFSREFSMICIEDWVVDCVV